MTNENQSKTVQVLAGTFLVLGIVKTTIDLVRMMKAKPCGCGCQDKKVQA